MHPREQFLEQEEDLSRQSLDVEGDPVLEIAQHYLYGLCWMHLQRVVRLHPRLCLKVRQRVKGAEDANPSVTIMNN